MSKRKEINTRGLGRTGRIIFAIVGVVIILILAASCWPR